VKSDLYLLPAHSLLALLKEGKVSSEEIISAALQRIAEMEAGLNSFITLFKEDSLTQARKIDSHFR